MASTDRIQGIRSDLAIKAPCRVGTTANITLAGLQTVDGVALAAGDRVLVKDQTDTTENGLYSAAAGAWPRTKDFDGIGDVVNGTQVLITEGSVSAGVFYSVSADEPVIPGASAVVFADSAVAAGAVAAHAADPTAAHAASAISYAGSSGLSSTDVEAALDELDAEKQPIDANTAKTNVAQSFTDKQTFTKTVKLQQVLEKITYVASPATGTINYDSLTQAILWFTSNATGNWTMNFRGDGSNTLENMLAINESITVTFNASQGVTPYYNNGAVQVDGNSHGVGGYDIVQYWLGGTAPTSGDASCVNTYSYTIMKSNTKTFRIFASKSKYA